MISCASDYTYVIASSEEEAINKLIEAESEYCDDDCEPRIPSAAGEILSFQTEEIEGIAKSMFDGYYTPPILSLHPEMVLPALQELRIFRFN